MLYVTTRDNKNAYTVHKTMLSDCAPDGGAFIPFNIPVYTETELDTLLEKTTGEIIAEILNSFFAAKLSGWSVDLAVGRNSFKTVSLSQKVVVAETWKNPGYQYQYIENNLYKLLSSSPEISKTPTIWVQVAIRIAMLFAAYKMMTVGDGLSGEEGFDVAVAADDFTDGMAAWYAFHMGLPIETIICAAAEHDAVWDLIHRKQISTAAISEKLSAGLEQLIYHQYGQEEARLFARSVQEKKLYTIDPETETQLSDCFFCSVAGKGRAGTVVNSLERTDSYNLSPATAIIYGAIQDYRAKTGENRTTLLFADQYPDK